MRSLRPYNLYSGVVYNEQIIGKNELKPSHFSGNVCKINHTNLIRNFLKIKFYFDCLGMSKKCFTPLFTVFHFFFSRKFLNWILIQDEISSLKNIRPFPTYLKGRYMTFYSHGRSFRSCFKGRNSMRARLADRVLECVKKLAIFGCFFFCSSAVFGQGMLRGVISDSLTGKSLVGANVYLVGTALGDATDLYGMYRIEQIPAGRYTLCKRRRRPPQPI